MSQFPSYSTSFKIKEKKINASHHDAFSDCLFIQANNTVGELFTILCSRSGQPLFLPLPNFQTMCVCVSV